MDIQTLFTKHIPFNAQHFADDLHEVAKNQAQTADVFSKKWIGYANKAEEDEQQRLWDFQKEWYLRLYGFPSVEALAEFLQQQRVVFDAGCGLGYLSDWFASLAPETLIIGMDISEAAEEASRRYQRPNLYFLRGDIAHTPFANAVIDYVSCHAVIMHTQDPATTFAELARVLTDSPEVCGGGGQFACYVYAKKALPRELVDDYFRTKCHDLSHNELREMSEQLTELGKRLQELKVEIDVPAIPLLGIKSGKIDIQRFIYWNFLKCFYNEQLGLETSIITNYDWYSPSNAKRYSESEFKELGIANHLQLLHFHSEEACFGARFAK